MYRKLFFNLIYLKRPIWDTGKSPPELLDFIATHTPGSALDLGCGTGTNVITLARHGWKVTGVDYSILAINRAERKAKENNVSVNLEVKDVTRLDNIDDKFDLILDIGCFHSLPASGRQRYITTVDRLLADVGTYLLYTFLIAGQEWARPGSTEANLQFISDKLYIVDRKDGTERGIRSSAWFNIKKKP